MFILFTDYYSNAACPGTGCPWKNISEAETHMNYVTNVIATLNPDFVNLCEVEDASVCYFTLFYLSVLREREPCKSGCMVHPL